MNPNTASQENLDFLQSAILFADQHFIEAKNKLQNSINSCLRQHLDREATLENSVLSQSLIDFVERGIL